MSSSNSRVIWIDNLKGFAAILVVLGHVVDGYRGAGMFPDRTLILRNLYNGIYFFHMALFFALSGMTFRLAYFKTDSDGTVLLKSREKIHTQILNIILIYVFYCILMVLAKVILANNVNNPASLLELLFIWRNPVWPYWYLYVLIIYYVLFPRIICGCLHKKHMIIVGCILIAASISSTFCYIHGWFEIQHALKFALFFYIGIMTVEKKTLDWGKTIILALVSVAVIIRFWNDNRYLTDIPVITTLAPFGIVLLIIKISSSTGVCNQSSFLSFLGERSLEIYVLNCFFTAGNRLVLPKLGITNFWLSIIGNTVFAVIIPVLVSVISKRLGFFNVLFAPVKLIKRRY